MPKADALWKWWERVGDLGIFWGAAGNQETVCFSQRSSFKGKIELLSFKVTYIQTSTKWPAFFGQSFSICTNERSLESAFKKPRNAEESKVKTKRVAINHRLCPFDGVGGRESY